ncbi:MAG: hypothetical protein DRI57_22320 [Deltaproteobacteria bacterium]|nr:MAG: hypothetical protein DRI57_22320 [Deltaproteobacteria bacterium]
MPGILFPVSPRLCGRQNILLRRQGRGVLLFLSCRNYPRETVSGRLRQPGIRDESCKHRKLNSPAPLRGDLGYRFTNFLIC